MRILICDDDRMFSAQLEKCITDYFHRNELKAPEIAIFDSGEELLGDTGERDIVFLDVEMPGLSGIYIGNELKKKNVAVIIFVISSFSEYLDEAMRFHVFRYLSKPLERQRLFRNLRDALQVYHSAAAKLLIETRQGCYTSLQTIKYWLGILNMNCFFQPHRSFIINMKYVSGFDHSVIQLCENRIKAYLTRRKYTEFKQAYLLYLESAR